MTDGGEVAVATFGKSGPGAAERGAARGCACSNCATPLLGPWCHACGQFGEDFHRSIGHLCAELFEGLLHLDGRLWRTLPDLILRPAALTRAYLDGRRAPQIPPLRLFLVILLAIFVVGGATGGGGVGVLQLGLPSKPGLTLGARPKPAPAIEDVRGLTPSRRAQIEQSIRAMNVTLWGKPNIAATVWLRDRLTRALADPEKLQLVMETWAERFAFLMLPISTLLLSGLFVFQRRFFLFDHMIFSLHSLSAMGLLLTTSMLASLIVGDWALLVLMPAPAHLFAHLRGVYRTSLIGALVRMVLLFFGSVIAVLLLMFGLVAVGLNGL